MNLAEKLAGTYLRMNGFLLAPQFTVFDGEQHNHIDIIGLRPPGSHEKVGNYTLPTDAGLFDAIHGRYGMDAQRHPIAVMAEVRTNDRRDKITAGHVTYASRFLAVRPDHVVRLQFFDGDHTIVPTDSSIDIGLKYAGQWIIRRIEAINGRSEFLGKGGSWHMSEPFLSDLLSLHNLGLLKGD